MGEYVSRLMAVISECQLMPDSTKVMSTSLLLAIVNKDCSA